MDRKMGDDSQAARDAVVSDVIPSDWDRDAYDVAIKIRDVMHFMAEFEVTGSGLGADGAADISVRHRGEEFWISVKKLPPKEMS